MRQDGFTDPTVPFDMGADTAGDFVVRELALPPKHTPADVRASLFTVAPGASTTLESHAVHELWLVISGEGELHYDGCTFRLRPNTVYYFEPFKAHQGKNDGTQPLVSYSVWWP